MDINAVQVNVGTLPVVGQLELPDLTRPQSVVIEQTKDRPVPGRVDRFKKPVFLGTRVGDTAGVFLALRFAFFNTPVLLRFF